MTLVLLLETHECLSQKWINQKSLSIHVAMDGISIFVQKLPSFGISVCMYINQRTNTVQDGQKITQNFLGEHKVITTEQQFLGVMLSFFMHLRWLWLLRLFAVLL